MRFLRCVRAEWLLVSPRVTRTRLGLSLLLLTGTLVWLNGRLLDPSTIALQAGALGSIIGAWAHLGPARERASLSVALAHPTSGLAIATGRWVAVVLPAALITVASTLVVGWDVAAVIAGLTAAATVGSCALALVVSVGRSAAGLLFLLIAVAGAITPERLVDLAQPTVARLALASALELGPALWHYRGIAGGDVGALAHASAWTALGILLTAGFVARRR